MPNNKHYVFSARTTEAGLRALNQIRQERGIGWDELVVDAVCAHYGLDRSVLVLPKAEKTPKVEKPKGKAKAEAKPKAKAKAKLGVKAKAGKKEPKPKAPTELPGAAEEPEGETTGAAAED
jgi:hypothetical protein